MRTLALTMRSAMNAENTGEVPVFLVTITHPQLDAPILLSTDPTERISDSPLTYGTRSRGLEYIFLPMSLSLPDEKDEGIPMMQMIIDNVDREMVGILRSTSTPSLARIELMLASAPDVVEIALPELEVVAADYDEGQITLTKRLNGLASEPFPQGSFSPATFPGLF